MAENINIKVLIDAAESAKTIQDTRKALKDLRSAALQVEDGSAAFKQITQAAGQLQDKMGDLTAEVSYFAEGNPLIRNAQGMISVMEGVGGAFNVAQGALALFGAENAQLEATMQKMVIVMGIINGLKELSVALDEKSNLVLFVQNGLKSTAIALAGEEAVALAAEAVAAGTATVAQRALNAAMTANPILATIGLIVTITSALFAWTMATEDNTKAEEKATKAREKDAAARKRQLDEQKKYADYIGKEATAYVLLAEKLKASEPGSKERSRLIKEMNENYGTHIQNLKDEAKFQEQVTKSVDDYIKFLKLKYALQREEGFINQNLAQQQIIRDDMLKLERLRESIRKKNGLASEKEINELRAIEKKYFDKSAEDQLAALEKSLKTRVEYTQRLEANITKSNLKVANDSVKTENDANDEKIESKKEFVVEYNKLDDLILKNNIEISDEISKLWSDSYDAQKAALEQNLIAEKQLLTTQYQEALDEIKRQFEEWRTSDAIVEQIKVGGWDYNEQLRQFEIANDGLIKRRLLLERQTAMKIELLEKDHLVELEKLRKDHEARIKAIMKDTAQAALASPEYKRYLEYITLQNDQAQKKIQEANAKTIEKNNKDLVTRVKIYQKHIKTIEDIAKEENLMLSKDSQGLLIISSEFLNALGEDMQKSVIDSYNDAYTQMQQFRGEIGEFAQSYVNAGTTIGEQLNKIASDEGITDANGEIIKLAEDQKDLISDLAKQFPDLMNDADKFAKAMGLGASDADKQMMKYIMTLKRLNLVDQKEFAALGNFSDAVDKVNGALDINSKLQEKVAQMGPSNIIGSMKPVIDESTIQTVEDVFKKVFGLTREIRQNEAGENKLLVAVYRDKLKVLQEGETSVGNAIEKANNQAIEAGKQTVEQQKINLAAAQQTTQAAISKLEKEYAGKPIPKELIDKAKESVVNAQKELDKAVSNLTKAETAQKEYKGFKIFPTKEELAAGVMGLEQALDKYPDIASKITEATQKRYDELAKISAEFYEKEKFELFMSLKKGDITQEEYDKKLEAMKINHEENMLSLDVAYGKKGQDALEESEKKKTAIIQSEEDKRKANRQRAIDEALTLENQLADLVMQIWQNQTESDIQGINDRANARIEAINAEKAAWEDSLKERTVQEIQESEKRKSFELQIKAEEDARNEKIRQEKSQQFSRQQKMDAAQALINGAVAFTKNYAVAGPFAVAINALLAAQIAAQIGIIMAQKPAFAQGGLVTGPGGPKDDMIDARLSNGESVINAKSTKQFAPLLSAINQAGGGKPIPSPAGGAMAAGGGGMPVQYIGEKAMPVDNRDVVAAIERLSQRPIETYVKESSITSAQATRRKEDRRSSY